MGTTPLDTEARMIIDVESLIGKRITAYLIGEKFDELTGKLVKAEQGRLTIEDSTGCWFVYEYESIDYIEGHPFPVNHKSRAEINSVSCNCQHPILKDSFAGLGPGAKRFQYCTSCKKERLS